MYYCSKKFIIRRPSTEPIIATQPTLRKYQPSFMRSIFISASPLILPIHKMFPPTEDEKAIAFQQSPRSAFEAISAPSPSKVGAETESTETDVTKLSSTELAA